MGEWVERLIGHAVDTLAANVPVILAGVYIIPADEDIYDAQSWAKDALLQPESRAAFRRLPQSAGFRLGQILLSSQLARLLLVRGRSIVRS